MMTTRFLIRISGLVFQYGPAGLGRRWVAGLGLCSVLAVLCGAAPSLRAELPGGGVLNSPVNHVSPVTNDYNPLLIPGATGANDTLLYTSDRAEVNERGKQKVKSHIAELWFATRPVADREHLPINEGWSTPQLYSPRDEQFPGYVRGAVCHNRERNVFIYAAEQAVDGGRESNTSSLFNLYLTDDNFKTLRPLTEINDPEAWDTQPTLTPDGRTLYFVSNRPTDPTESSRSEVNKSRDKNIWYARFDDNSKSWSEPKSLTQVNSSGNDITPHVDAQGFLYFASDWKASLQSTGDYDIYRVKLGADGLPQSAPLLLEESLKKEYQKRPLLPEGLAYNTPADDMFPWVMPGEQPVLFLSSNRNFESPDPDEQSQEQPEFSRRKRGLDLYAINFPAPKICVELEVLYRLFDPEGLDDQGWRPLESPISINLHKSDGTLRNIPAGTMVELEPNASYRAELAELDELCFDCVAKEKYLTITTAGRDNCDMRDTFRLDCRLIRDSVSFKDQHGLGYFITGYWKPNTKNNYSEFSQRWNSGALEPSAFVDPFDFNYQDATERIDQQFQDRIYRKIADVLQQFEKNCLGMKPILRITVHGFTDPCRLTPGRYSCDGDIEVGGLLIPTGQNMWASSAATPGGGRINLPGGGQEGNVFLSKLRAYFTAETIKKEMAADNALFRKYLDSNQIVFKADGFGIFGTQRCDGNLPIDDLALTPIARKHIDPDLKNDGRKTETYRYKEEATAGSSKALLISEPCNVPLNRRFTVYLEVVTEESNQWYTIGRCGYDSPEYIRYVSKTGKHREERRKEIAQRREDRRKELVDNTDDRDGSADAPISRDSPGPRFVVQFGSQLSEADKDRCRVFLDVLDAGEYVVIKHADGTFSLHSKQVYSSEPAARESFVDLARKLNKLPQGFEREDLERSKLTELIVPKAVVLK